MKKCIIRLSMLFACCIVWSGLVGFKYANQQAAVSSLQIIDQVNRTRLELGYHALSLNQILMNTAQATADEMASLAGKSRSRNALEVALGAGYGDRGSALVKETIAFLPSDADTNTVLAVLADPEQSDLLSNQEIRDIGAGIAFTADGEVIYVIHTGMTGTMKDALDQPAPDESPDEDLVSRALKVVQPGDAAGELNRSLVQLTPTTSPMIPGTGRKIDSSMIATLAAVAIIGFVLVFLGLILKK